MYYLLNLIKFSVKKTITEKILENGKKNTGKVREFCQSGKVGTLFEGVTDTYEYICNEGREGIVHYYRPQTKFGAK